MNVLETWGKDHDLTADISEYLVSCTRLGVSPLPILSYFITETNLWVNNYYSFHCTEETKETNVKSFAQSVHSQNQHWWFKVIFLDITLYFSGVLQ